MPMHRKLHALQRLAHTGASEGAHMRRDRTPLFASFSVPAAFAAAPSSAISWKSSVTFTPVLADVRSTCDEPIVCLPNRLQASWKVMLGAQMPECAASQQLTIE